LNPAVGDQEVLIGDKNGKISCFDSRNQKTSCTFDAHSIYVTDVDYNQNKPNVIVSSGKDCQIRIWDIRNPSTFLKEFKNHSHW
jgi:WD40 repeat protein